MQIRPLHDRLVVRRIQAESTSAGGIIIPENAKEKPLEGEVIACGKGRVMDDGSVRELGGRAGDKVLCAKYAGTEVKSARQGRVNLKDAYARVKDGELFFAKGYGYADREKKIPVSADTTLFRPGSTSKLFTWTAVMQLVEQGKLDLHTDVDRYLKTFALEDTYSEPVTLAHLLTHRAGFEDPPYTSNTDPELVEPLGPYLAAKMPPRMILKSTFAK